MQEEYLLDVFDYITASADDILGLNESQVRRNFRLPPPPPPLKGISDNPVVRGRLRLGY